MNDQRTDGEGSGIKRLRISLKACLLVLTAVAVVLGVVSELYRASVRAERRARAENTLQNARGIHETWTSLLKQQIVTDPAKASEYEDQLRQADADLKEVERRMNELRK